MVIAGPTAPSPFEGEGRDGGVRVSVFRSVFNAHTPSCAPRIGLQADAVRRARRMRLENPASPPTPLKGEGAIHFNAANCSGVPTFSH
jgi:hypothetical protein